MAKPKRESDKNDIDEIVDRNRRLIEALKNLNSKICCDSKWAELNIIDSPEEHSGEKFITPD
jgi:hypothetical protein